MPGTIFSHDDHGDTKALSLKLPNLAFNRPWIIGNPFSWLFLHCEFIEFFGACWATPFNVIYHLNRLVAIFLLLHSKNYVSHDDEMIIATTRALNAPFFLSPKLIFKLSILDAPLIVGVEV